MKFHNMQVKHDPANGFYGDCFRVCIASLLGYENPLDVPHFFEGGDKCDPDWQWERVQEWLKKNHSLTHVSVPWDLDKGISVDDVLELLGEKYPDVVYMLLGRSPRENHVVICRGGTVLHDPHTGSDKHCLIGPDRHDGFWWTEFLVHYIPEASQ